MVPHSQNVAYSDGGSEVLWEDGERAFRRSWRLDDEGKRRAVLLVAPAADHPSRSNLDRLTHEYELRTNSKGVGGAAAGARTRRGPDDAGARGLGRRAARAVARRETLLAPRHRVSSACGAGNAHCR